MQYDELSERQRSILRTVWRKETETPGSSPVKKFSKRERQTIIERMRRKSEKLRSSTQMELRALEEDHYRPGLKKRIIMETLTGGGDTSYLSFFVCRNPVERLVSVYNYLIDMLARKRGKSRSHPSRWSHWRS